MKTKSNSKRSGKPLPLAKRKTLARLVSAKEFWTPERIAQFKAEVKADPAPGEEEFVRIMYEVEGPNLIRLF